MSLQSFVQARELTEAIVGPESPQLESSPQRSNFFSRATIDNISWSQGFQIWQSNAPIPEQLLSPVCTWQCDSMIFYPRQVSGKYPRDCGNKTQLPASMSDKLMPQNDKRLRCFKHGCGGRAFSCQENFRRHLREQDRVGIVVCAFCEKTFSRKSNREQHLSKGRCHAFRKSMSEASVSSWEPELLLDDDFLNSLVVPVFVRGPDEDEVGIHGKM